MKRDMEMIRNIVSSIRNSPSAFLNGHDLYKCHSSFSDKGEDYFLYQIWLADDVGYIKSRPLPFSPQLYANMGDEYTVTSWGHDWLEERSSDEYNTHVDELSRVKDILKETKSIQEDTNDILQKLAR